jgi:4-alpha-glucanotransferase
MLPINETGNDNSPYNAISSVALDPMTIDLHQMEDLAIDDLARLRQGTISSTRGGPWPTRWSSR